MADINHWGKTSTAVKNKNKQRTRKMIQNAFLFSLTFTIWLTFACILVSYTWGLRETLRDCSQFIVQFLKHVLFIFCQLLMCDGLIDVKC